MKREAVSLLLCWTLSPLVATSAVAQVQPPPESDAPPQGALADASFDAMLRKYLPPANAFSPFHAWDAHMTLRLTMFRKGRNAVGFTSRKRRT
jgi:hypothetical protein